MRPVRGWKNMAKWKRRRLQKKRKTEIRLASNTPNSTAECMKETNENKMFSAKLIR